MANPDVKINLNLKQLTSIVRPLSPNEKMKLNDAIGDEKMPIPQEHQKLVLQRVRKSKQNPNRMVDWDKATKLLKP